MKYHFRLLIILIGAVFGFLFFSNNAFAADPKPTIQRPSMKARYVGQSIPDPITLAPGETKTITMQFKNIGTEAWHSLNQHQDGFRHISAYTMEPRYRDSVFRASNWISARQTASITKNTAPGEIATLTIELKAPDTLGTYKEEFYLAAENYTWIDGGYFFLDIVVKGNQITDNKQQITDTSNSSKQVSGRQDESLGSGDRVGYRAKRIFQNKKAVRAVGGEQITMVLAFQNLGEKAWERYRLVANAPSSVAAESTVSFADAHWQSAAVVMAKQQTVNQFDIVRETFTFLAPAKKGTYEATFYLQAEDELFDDVVEKVSVTVTEDAPTHYSAPQMKDDTVEVFTPRLDSEPRIRVGLWKPEEQFVQFRSYEDDYDIYDGTVKVGTLPQKQMAVVKYENGVYSITYPGVEIRSTAYLRLSPVRSPHSVFVLHNYDRHVRWKGPQNFNKYRGAMELRLANDGKTLYVINDLLMEDYVAGIGENSNNSPEEYLKSQSVAQRTYAYYIKEHSDKHNKRNFDVVATTGDQLYLGYENEPIMNRFVAAARATRGYMVTYDNDIVITPYFARTHCATKGWHEVWGGAVRPWLVSVRTNYDCQRALSPLGHLVGMSQIDASLRAEEEGLDFKALLRYYYTDTKAERIYE